jgi:hypothetical protein
MEALRSPQPNLDVGSASSMHRSGNRFAALIPGAEHLFRHVYFPTRLTWPTIFLFRGNARSSVPLPCHMSMLFPQPPSSRRNIGCVLF